MRQNMSRRFCPEISLRSMADEIPAPNPSEDPITDLDQSVKELLKSYPVDTLEFLLPEIIQERGRPLSWQFHDTNARKHDLSDKGFVMDVNIRYTFQKGSVVLVVLIEHWSTARSVDLYRTAHYYLDLLKRFPKEEVIPIALITALKPAKIRDTLHAQSRGRTWLHFETIIREVSREEASSWQAAKNVLGWILCGAMAGQQSRSEKVFGGAMRFKEAISPAEMWRLFPLMAEIGKLKLDEVEELRKRGSMVYSEVAAWMEAQAVAVGEAKGLEIGEAKGLAIGEARGEARGRLEGKLEAVQRMLELNSPWEFISNVTGISQAEYESLVKK